MKNGIIFVLALAGWAGPPQLARAQASSPSTAIDVINYDAAIEPDIDSKTVSGKVTIQLADSDSTEHLLEFDSGDLIVDSVRVDGRPQSVDQVDHRLRVIVDRAVNTRNTRDIDVEYHGTPRRGVQFGQAPPYVFTVFSTSEWLICIDAPSDKASLHLTIVVPAGFKALANGELIEHRGLNGNKELFEWRQSRPFPTYTFGFAVGKFTEVQASPDNFRFRILGRGFSEEEMRKVFPNTADALAFFAERAGVPYGDTSYSQVLAGSGIGQEMSGFAIFPESYGRAVLADGSPGLLGAHELAHQWWGNLVTCRDWTHFWLNEGFATFMAAAYAEHAGGREAYLRQIENSRTRYEAVREAGHDRPLVFPDWNRPSADDRTLVYQKGAYVLYLLREQLGDSQFWKGIRDYTRHYAGGSVTTDDFQRSMEQSTGLDLSAFFARWVYMTSPP